MHVKKAVGLPRALFSALTFHLNWLEAKTGYLPANWDVMWSLSVEEMFYLFFPLVCLVFVGERSPLRRNWMAPSVFACRGAAGFGPVGAVGMDHDRYWAREELSGRYECNRDGVSRSAALSEVFARGRDSSRVALYIRNGWLGADRVDVYLAALGVAAWHQPVSGADRSGRYSVAARRLPGDAGDGTTRVSWWRLAHGAGTVVWAAQL